MQGKNLIQIIILVFLMQACNSGQEKSVVPKKQVEEKKETKAEEHARLQAELYEYYDTTLSTGYFLKYVLDSTNTIRIIWGNKDFQRWKSDEQYPGWAPSEFKFEFKDFIALGHSCGSPCWSLTLLPKNEKDSIMSYDYDITSDVFRHYIFYKALTEDSKPNDFFIENIITKKKTEVRLDSLGDFAFWMQGIDSAAFVKEGLFVRWKTEADLSDFAKKKEKIFKFKN